jgi:hypothetical protein
VAFANKHPNIFTLIRPSATFSLREKESSGTHAWPSSLSQRERVGERESAENYNDIWHTINSLK